MKKDSFHEFYRILYDEHSADVRAQNVFLNNFESIDAFLNFDPSNFKNLKDCGKKTAEILKNIQLTLLSFHNDSGLFSSDFEQKLLAGLDFKIFLENYKISRRSKNIILNAFKDPQAFLDADPELFHRLPNCGDKSALELKEAQDHLSKLGLEKLGSFEKKKLVKHSQPRSFSEIIAKATEKIDQENIATIESRLSGEISLEEAGDLWVGQDGKDVTRERIRQIEGGVIRRINRFQGLIYSELEKCLSSSNILYMWQLEIENSFFEGISRNILRYRSQLLKKVICGSGSPVFRDDFSTRSVSIMRRGALTYKELIHRMKQNDLLEHEIADYLVLYKRNDLSNKIPEILADITPKSLRGKLNKYVKIILRDASLPLSQSQIKKKLKEYGLNNINQGRGTTTALYDAIQAVPNVYRFTERGWGIEEKFRKLDDEEVKAFGEVLVSYLAENDSKQFSCGDLLSYLVSQKINKDISVKSKVLSNSDIDWVLKKINSKYNSLKDLGRKTWVYTDNYLSERQNKMQLAIRVLDQNGRPMRLKKLKDAMSEIRSVGAFQPNTSRTNPDLIQIGHGIWGLRWRDVELTETEESLIHQNVLNEFNRGKKNLDTGDLQGILDMLGIDTINAWLAARILMRYVTTNNDRSGEHFKIIFSNNSDEFEIIDIRDA